MSKKKSPTITVDEWIDEAFTTLIEKPADAITVKDIMKKKNISIGRARNVLNKMVADGELTKGRCFDKGKVCNYYIRIKK